MKHCKSSSQAKHCPAIHLGIYTQLHAESGQYLSLLHHFCCSKAKEVANVGNPRRKRGTKSFQNFPTTLLGLREFWQGYFLFTFQKIFFLSFFAFISIFSDRSATFHSFSATGLRGGFCTAALDFLTGTTSLLLPRFTKKSSWFHFPKASELFSSQYQNLVFSNSELIFATRLRGEFFHGCAQLAEVNDRFTRSFLQSSSADWTASFRLSDHNPPNCKRLNLISPRSLSLVFSWRKQHAQDAITTALVFILLCSFRLWFPTFSFSAQRGGSAQGLWDQNSKDTTNAKKFTVFLV